MVRRTTIAALLVALGLTTFGAACGDSNSSDAGAGGQGGATPSSGGSTAWGGAPAFTGDPGQPANPVVDYPPGPYGDKEGTTVPNVELFGYVDPQRHSDPILIRFSDFYNPTGDAVYEQGSPYGEGNPKPKVLLINSAAIWCGPCQFEASDVLPQKYQELAPLGGQFLGVLTQKNNYLPADFDALDAWTTNFTIEHPFTVDPTDKLDVVFHQQAFPRNVLIDTRTMEIAKIVIGVPDDLFWGKFNLLLQ